MGETRKIAAIWSRTWSATAGSPVPTRIEPCRGSGVCAATSGDLYVVR